ncbi:MAG TPA: LytTR family DNA-binding domain-containing protein, partial [Saprospiraceae bacterium]|nr:LytTR family DNA-binding domain-containing protein [Saprospiraceae bacterium]
FCYLYFIWIFNYTYSSLGFFKFLIIADAVSIIPVGSYFAYIYLAFKDVKHAQSIRNQKTTITQNSLQIKAPEEFQQTSIEIIGAGKKEKYSYDSSVIPLIQAEDNYVILYTNESDKIKKQMIRIKMNEIEQQLNDTFIRVHRSFIVNKEFISSLSGNITNTKLRLNQIEEEIPVSRSLVPKIRLLLKN